MTHQRSRLEEHAADALRRARRLPVGPARNDLRQLAAGLLWLHRRGMSAAMEDLAVHRLADNRRAAVADSVARSFHTA
jgi:hypothetical protein